MREEIRKIAEEAYQAAAEVMAAAKVKPGELFVVGCSTSEVAGSKIGTDSSPELAAGLYEGIRKAAEEAGVYLVAQCCEHLNRALILEEEAALRYGYEPVNVRPQPKAGGSFATAAYGGMKQPVAVEHVKAHVGMDIGDTFIGMHLKDVAVPIRISYKQIGEAHLTCARTRKKFIGGCRAMYEEE